MRGRAIALGVVLGGGALTACHRDTNAPEVVVLESVARDATAPLLDAAAPSRCALAESGVTLGDVGDRRSLVIGDAVATNVGFVVGLVHAPSSGAEALIARVVGHSIESEWIVAKRAELIADAPPPIPLVGPSLLYAAYLSRDADAGSSRRISLKKSGVAAAVASFKVQAGDSLSFDAALASDGSRAALAWDDDAPKDGGIRIAVVPLTAMSAGSTPAASAAPTGAPRVVSDGVTDADAPRIAPRIAGGWWVAWTARREEPVDAGARVETPGEARAFTWIEVVAIDSNGAPAGPIRKLTSPTGHASSFELATRAHGELDVFARDELQSREGEGEIVHVVVREGSIDDAVVVATGAGRGAVDLVTGANGEAWLSFVDPQDHPRALPLGESRAPAAPATTEEALDGARLLAITSAQTPSRDLLRFVAAVPASDAAVFRDVACTP